MIFPVDTYVDSFLKRPARYLDNRANGRKHAGCDIYVPEGTPVRAVADGIIRQDLCPFYEGTTSIVVDHKFFIVRYGELSFEPPIKDGVYSNPTSGEIKEGRILGYVKKTKNYYQPMLHFEMYSGEGKGALTDKSSRPLQRRSDILDPTDFLMEWSRRRSCI